MKWTDINKLMWVFEANYDRLLTLVPRLDELNGLVTASVNGLMDLHLEVLDRSRYTTTISLTHYLDHQGKLIPNPYMRIRLYHDAKVAEVLAYQNQSRFKHEYPYPNPKMHQRHEKRQLNLFLAEWLTYCIARGYRFDAVPSFTDV
ncbi:MAG TPA: DUF1249 domain-containing protein [Gammaproteobacteria bacterium]|nr:DUF1249 domain-containing protein [Gammaproteobacteria bacterium]